MSDNTAKKVGNDLRQYFEKKGMEQQDVADILGITQASVSARFCGIKPFGKNAAKKWSEAFGFRVWWLITGEGDMFEDSTTSSPINQTITDNSGVAIQQAGNGNHNSVNTTHDEGFFTKLCAELMQQIMERDRKICCLEERVRELERKP